MEHKFIGGLMVPKTEDNHLIDLLENSPRFKGRPTYQVDKLFGCMRYVRNFRHAVDVGAHIGLWSRVLVELFEEVTGFEPIPEFAQMARFNAPAAKISEIALIDIKELRVGMKIDPLTTGNTHISLPGEDVDFRALPMRLDDFAGLMKPIDFMKIDCEGFESFVVRGGEGTIRTHKPCIMVEQKLNMGSKYGVSDGAAVDLLVSWGAKVRFSMSGDYCLSWDR